MNALAEYAFGILHDSPEFPPTVLGNVDMNETKIENRTVYFSGVSYSLYPFKLYPLHTDFPNTGAVYIYTRVRSGMYVPLYIGQAAKLGIHIAAHEKWVCVSKHFGNAVCVHFEDDIAARHQITRDLISKQQPVCNNGEEQRWMHL